MTCNDRGHDQTGRLSPSMILSQLSFLCTQLYLLGQGRPYDDTTSHGNHCLYALFVVYCRGYALQASIFGYQKLSVVLLTYLNQCLVEYLYVRIAAKGGYSRVLLLQDLCPASSICG